MTISEASKEQQPGIAAFTHVTEPLLRDLLGYYLNLRDGARVPRRDRISPLQFPKLLSSVFLYEYDRDSHDFAIRLAGEDIKRMLRTTKPGAKLSDVFPPEVVPQVQERYDRVCNDSCVMHNAGHVFHYMGGTGIGERLVMPLADAHGRNRFLIGATVYSLRHDRTHLAPGENPLTITYTPL